MRYISFNNHEVSYLVAHEVAKKLSDMGVYFWTRGACGSSFVNYILGITKTNPLPPHYKCPHCKYIEFLPEGEVESGFDLVSVYQEKKSCPKCGRYMIGDGHNLLFDMYAGTLHEPDTVRSRVSGEITVSASERTKSDNKLELLEEKRPTFEFDVPVECRERLEEELPEEIWEGIIRDRVLGVDEKKVKTPPIVYINYSIPLSDFTKFEKRTGISPDSIPIDGLAYNEVFSDDIYKDIDLLMNIPGPVEDIVSEMTSSTKLVCFSDMVKLLGLCHARANGLDYDVDAPAHRDDLIRKMLSDGLDMYDALKIAGQPGSDTMKLFPKAHDIEYAIMLFRLLWYRVHFKNIN